MFSAKKVKGRKLYELARRGVQVKRKPVPVSIYSLDILEVNLPLISFRISCSRGTYIRVAGVEMAAALGTVGHLTQLRRLAAGSFKVEEAVLLNRNWVLEEKLVAIEQALSHLYRQELSDEEAKQILKGQSVTLDLPVSEGDSILLIKQGKFLGIGQYRKFKKLWPKRLVATNG